MHSETGLSTPVGTRRRFFKWMTAAAMSLVEFGLGIPLVGYVISPALKPKFPLNDQQLQDLTVTS